VEDFYAEQFSQNPQGLSAKPARLALGALIIQERYRQQHWMYENRCHRISGRIVSISQPHVRPIVRGKASAAVEFGQGKRRFGLDLIMAKLANTSETAIAITFIVMNLEKWLQKLFFSLFICLQKVTKQARCALYAFTTGLQRLPLSDRMMQEYCQRT